MSKADTLLKKAAFYEKLALYSDRSVFLQALAQQGYIANTFGPEITSQLNRAIADLSFLGIDAKIVNALTDIMNSHTPTNRYLLVAYLTQAAAKFPQTPEHAAQLQNLNDLIGKLRLVGATSEEGSSPAVGAPSTTAPVAPTSKVQNFPPIPKETQDQLNKILLPYEKIAIPIKVDGQLGPETQKAIEIFKQTYNKPGTPKAIREIYLQVANPDIQTKTPF